MKTYYRSKEIYTEAGIVNGYLAVEAGRIVDIIDDAAPLNDYVDLHDLKILPGIFDTHNHGTNGWSLLKANTAKDKRTEVEGYLRALTSQGVTAVFPTATIEFFAPIADIVDKGYAQGASVMGIHSEGPWLNRVGEKGKRPENPYPPVDLKTAEQMVREARGLLKMVAMAPEIPGRKELSDYFIRNGITMAIAHTDGQYQITKQAIADGFRVATHLCNVMTGIHHRDFGCLGACLTDEHIWAELICDGLHVCNEMLAFVYQNKGRDQIMMISDCTLLSGIAPGYYRNDFLGGLIHVTADGFVLDENGRLRGSSKPVIYGMRNLVKNLHMSLTDVSRMASLNPAICHGYSERKGSLKVGKDADFIVIDDDFNLYQTFIAGQSVFEAAEHIDYFNPALLAMLKQER